VARRADAASHQEQYNKRLEEQVQDAFGKRGTNKNGTPLN